MMKWLIVDQKHRGDDTGRLLFQCMVLNARSIGHEKFCRFVLKDNASSQPFYRSLDVNHDRNEYERIHSQRSPASMRNSRSSNLSVDKLERRAVAAETYSIGVR